ncbi:MAG: ATP-dependent Clp protease proteolytic subunit, partial [Chloroflexia bacterium]|nr:ATP-dependent Clp protease proteolytic subunit [Chloroflexia bacterium]
RDTERDYFLTAQEAKEYGMVDEVLEPSKVLASVTHLSEPSENGHDKG